jgi:hypothetical protein
MQIAVHLDRARLFRWHLALIEQLSARGHTIAVSFRNDSEPLPVTLTALLDLDRVTLRSGTERYSVRLRASDFEEFSSSSASNDLTIDLSTTAKLANIDGRVLRPCFNGIVGDQACFAALLDATAPELCIADTPDQRYWPVGLPGIERPLRLSLSIDQVHARLIQGFHSAIAAIADGKHAPGDGRDHVALKPTGRPLAKSLQSFIGDRTRSKAHNVVNRATRNRAKWHVLWRWTEQPIERESAAHTTLRLPLPHFTTLPDDGQRFYADPFVIVVDGQYHLFVEDLPTATGRGIIAHTILTRDGITAPPAPVLDTGFHLSYPFVFEHEGTMLMMPEGGANGSLDLYRADPFPTRWVHAAKLINEPVHDATLFQHDGRFWIAAGSIVEQSSTWDALSLYHAPSPLGPWTPHAKNPVLIDARSARPAGRMWKHNGALYRPAQDCSQHYGGRLVINRVTKLTPDDFAEEVVCETSFTDQKRFLGPHSLNFADGLEVVDVYARPGDLRAGYRATGGL